MKKIIFLALVIGLASPVFAEQQSMKDRIDSWLSSSPSRTAPPTIDGEDPGNDPPVGDTPVGDGLLVLFALGGAYILYKSKKQRQEL